MEQKKLEKIENKETKNKPFAVYKKGNVKIVCWKNTSSAGEDYFSFGIEQFFKDEDGNFKSNSSFNLYQLKIIATICDFIDNEKISVEKNNL